MCAGLGNLPGCFGVAGWARRFRVTAFQEES